MAEVLHALAHLGRAPHHPARLSGDRPFPARAAAAIAGGVFPQLSSPLYRHWTPEAEAPVAALFRTAKSPDVRVQAGRLLFVNADINRYFDESRELLKLYPPRDRATVLDQLFNIGNALDRLTPQRKAWLDQHRSGR